MSDCKITEDGVITLGGAGGTVTAAPPVTSTNTAPEYLYQHHESIGIICDRDRTHAEYIDAYKRYQHIQFGKSILKKIALDGLFDSDPSIAASWAEIIGDVSSGGFSDFAREIDSLPLGDPGEHTYVSPYTFIKWRMSFIAVGQAAETGGLIDIFPSFDSLQGNPIRPKVAREPFRIEVDQEMLDVFQAYIPTLQEYTQLRCDICDVCLGEFDQNTLIPEEISQPTQAQTAQNAQTAPQQATPQQVPPAPTPAEIEELVGPMLTGQRIVVVNEENRAAYAEDTILSRINSQIAQIKDPVRRALRSFWLYQPNSSGFPAISLANHVDYAESQEVSNIYVSNRIEYESWNNASTPDINSSFPVNYEEFVLEANTDGDRFRTDGELDPLKWSAYVASFFNTEANSEFPENAILGKAFDDVVFEVAAPYDRDRFSGEDAVPGEVWADITPQYNYLAASYELSIDNRRIGEGFLPNWYDFLVQEETPLQVPNIRLNLSGDIKIVPNLPVSPIADSLNFTPQPFTPPVPGLPPVNLSIGQMAGYLAEFGNKFPGVVPIGYLQQDVVMDSSAVKLFTDSFGRRVSFPMHVDIELYDRPVRALIELFDELGVESSFVHEAINQSYNPSKELTFNDGYWLHKANFKEEAVYRVFNQDLMTAELNYWFENELDSATELDDSIKESAAIYELGGDTGFDNSVSMVILKAALRQIIRNNSRTMEQVIAGQMCHSETLLYRVDKYDVNPAGEPGDRLQTFWIPSSDKYDAIRLADNQVKYDKRYIYEVSTYKVVFGTKYQYINGGLLNNDPASFKMRLGVVSRPSIKLVSVPSYSEPVYVLDRPPIEPEVSISSYQGVRDKLLIRFQAGIGRAYVEPIRLGPEADYSKFYESQRSDQLGTRRLWFESDDSVSTFETWVSENKPRSYRDFKFLRAIDTRDATAQVITVPVNRKVYFTFVSVDSHGHRGIPSPPYEVIMREDSGVSYYEAKVIDFSREAKVTKSIPARRYVSILPTIEQVMIDYESMKVSTEADTIQGVEPKVGTGDLFGNTFKVRVTSKKTGRSFELVYDYELNTHYETS